MTTRAIRYHSIRYNGLAKPSRVVAPRAWQNHLSRSGSACSMLLPYVKNVKPLKIVAGTHMDNKKCSYCDIEKPATTDYFHALKTTKDGLTGQCKDCRRGRRNGTLKSKKEELPEGQKRCARCKEVKLATLEHFPPKRGANPLYSYCRKCVAKINQEWVRNNPEKQRARSTRYRENNKEKLRLYMAGRRQQNPENHREAVRRNRQRYPEKARDVNKRWALKNPDKVRLKRYRRRNAKGHFSKEDLDTLLKQQGGRCHWCGKKLGKKYHIDHRIPIIEGGTNNPDNLVIAHPKCNLSKGGKMPWEFMEGRLL